MAVDLPIENVANCHICHMSKFFQQLLEVARYSSVL